MLHAWSTHALPAGLPPAARTVQHSIRGACPPTPASPSPRLALPSPCRRLPLPTPSHHRHGDAHVGFRDGDDAELARWATKQRAEHRGGQLAEPKQAALEAAGFEWDGERAEWLRWYNEIQAFKRRHGHCQPQPLAHPNGAGAAGGAGCGRGRGGEGTPGPDACGWRPCRLH